MIIKSNPKDERRRQWQPTPVLLPGKSCGRRSLVGCSLWTEQLHFHFSLSCTGGGNGNPLQYSCLENPRDGSLVGCCLWGHTESDMTERLHFHFSLSCIGECNGNPLQYSCLENPRDGSLVGCHLQGHTESDTTEQPNNKLNTVFI